MPEEELLLLRELLDGRHKVAFVVAHFDDEIVGAGGLLSKLESAEFVHTTDSSPKSLQDARASGCKTRSEYAHLRRRELLDALTVAGFANAPITDLRCPDQESCLSLVPLTRWLVNILDDSRPDSVLTHPYEGGHPDHDATSFVVHAAAALLGGIPVIEMTSYHMGRQGIQTGEFLPAERDEVRFELKPEDQRLKRCLIECFPSQAATLRYFSTVEERFRFAPKYDFRRPPHEGQLFYEKFPWGMDRQRFCRLASEALDLLGLECPL